MNNPEHMRSIGLGVFVDYAHAPASEQMRVISEQRRLLNDPGSGGPQAYGAARTGLKKVVRTGDPRDLRRMVFSATRTMVTHYEELAAGMQGFLDQGRPKFVETGAASWTWGPLSLIVHQHVGMRIKGKPTIVFLYLKQSPLVRTDGGAMVAWRTLERAKDGILPGADVAVLDVRRSQLLRPTRIGRTRLDAWIESVALGYVEHWRRAA